MTSELLKLGTWGEVGLGTMWVPAMIMISQLFCDMSNHDNIIYSVICGDIIDHC